MFPTFISIIDIQSWWEVPSIAHFCSLFRTAFNLLDFDIEDLEEALLTDGTEESSWLQDLIVRLLSGCLPNNEISTFNYQMFLRRLFRQKCQEHDRYNPFNTDIDFQLLPLRTKVDILHALCDFRLDAEDVLDQLKNLEADSLRVEPLGYDSNESAYWYFYGTRLYREDFKTKNNKKKSVWQVICFTEDDWFQLTKKFKKSTSKVEKQLYQTLSENFLPELPRLFKEKENLARKRLLENLPRRTSSRLRKLECEADKELAEGTEKERQLLDQQKPTKEEEEQIKKEKDKKELKKRRQEAYDRRTKLKEQSEEESCLSETSTERYEMAGHKSKKSKGRQRKVSYSSSSSKDNANKTSKKSKKYEKELESITKTASTTTTVGRQTNNSLSAATGQILIQPLPSTNKKIKTSQIFRQTDEDLQTGMHKILDYIKNHEDAWPFADPVEEEFAPNYYSVIRKPMDLQTMEERLDSGYYKTFAKFRADFQLIVDNCRLYNGVENEYTEMVDNLLKGFERATEKYLDQISSSDDEIMIEYSNTETEKNYKKRKSIEEPPPTPRRKPTLAAKTDKKRERSISEDSINSKSSYESFKTDTKSTKVKKIEKITKNKKQSKPIKTKKDKDSKKHKSDTKKEVTETKKEKSENKKEKSENKKEKSETKKEKFEIKKEKSEKKEKIENKKSQKEIKKGKKAIKKAKKKSPVRSRSSSRSPSRSPVRSNQSSPPPSWPPSSPDTRFDFNPKKTSKKRTSQDMSDSEEFVKGKHKKQSKYEEYPEEGNEDFDVIQDKGLAPYSYVPLSPKPKDKHNKLRETIEKLKAKSEIKLKDEFDFELEHSKENKDKNKKQEKEEKTKPKVKEKNVSKPVKSDTDLDLDGNSTMDSILSDSKRAKKNSSKNVTPVPPTKPTSNYDALTIATEQTLKDINKWLDDTPKFSEFSSASNSPSYTGLDDFDTIGSKIDPVPGKKTEKPPGTKKEGGNKEKKKPFRDPSKFFKRREVQRTTDRLQPGKSKGNLISNVQNTNKVDEIFPLGPLSKIKDTKNSLIVKTDTNAPKLSLGSVLDSFGKHNFVDDNKKEEQKVLVEIPKQESSFSKESTNVEVKETESISKEEIKDEKKDKEPCLDDSSGGATPNLSAWFKAFGAPKVQPPQKKTDLKPDGKENEKCEDNTTKSGVKVPLPTPSPNTDSPTMPHGQPIPRQRKISTGSSMSERSSFSQDMDSPRVGIDERGAYPAPYPSPLHRSPSGASPVMASPRPDISPKAATYPTINGQIRCGFYQDTVSNKSSPDKSCSPRENPQSPYLHYSEHVYTPNTTETSYYSYANSPYYTHAPNYSSTNPTPPYNMEGSSSYYDASKSLTEQYQAKNLQNYTANSPSSNHSSPAHPQLSPSIHSPHSPIVHPQHSPGVNSQHSPGVLSPHSPGMYPQHSPKVIPQQSPNVHPANSPIHPQLSPNVQPHGSPLVQHSPNMQMQNSPNMQMQNSPNMQMQNSPNVQMQNSPNMNLQHSPNMQQQNSPSMHVQQSSGMQSQNQETETFQEHTKTAEKPMQQQSPQSSLFPVKKRSYNDSEIPQLGTQRYEIDCRLSQREVAKNMQDSMMDKSNVELSSFKEKDESKSYVHQNIPDPKQLTVETSRESFKTSSLSSPLPQKPVQNIQINTPPPMTLETTNLSFANTNLANPFNTSFTNDSNYPLNIPSARNLASSQPTKIDMSKYTNMGYSGPDVNYSRPIQQFNKQEVSSVRTTISSTVSQKQNPQLPSSNVSSAQAVDTRLRYNNPNTALQQMGYKSADLTNTGTPQQAHNNFSSSSMRTSETDKLLQTQEIPSGFKPDVTIPRPTYNASALDVEQPLGLGRNMANLSHIVDRYNNDERMMAGLQTSSSFYTDKGLGTSQLFNKPISTSSAGLPMFSQANMAAMQSYNQNIQGTSAAMYNRPIPEVQNTSTVQNEPKGNIQVPMQEKKTKKRKSTKSAVANAAETQQPNASHQGFQSYAGLKSNSSIEPSAISLKTSSVVPGSAFNFGPTPSALGIGSMYGDKDAYPNFLEEFRSTPNYYMAAAAAAHHRSTPEASDKQTRAAHQSSNPQTAPGYPFLGAPPQARPTYPIGAPFIPNAQAQLMDTSSPLYQHYLQAGVLNQGLLGPPGAYPPGYHPALSIRQPYDSMTRPSWL